MARQIRSDILIGNLEKKLGIPASSIRHQNWSGYAQRQEARYPEKEAEKANKSK